MSRITLGVDAKYKLVPQTYSDSDLSEEELHSIMHTHGFQIILKNQIHNDDTNSIDPENGAVKNIHKSLHQMECSETSQSALSSSKTCHKPSKNDLYYIKPGSLLQKIAFISSILLCIGTLFVFLWLIPCEIESCPAKLQSLSMTSWDKLLTDLELKGAITKIEGTWKQDQTLLFMLRGSLWKQLHVSLRGDNFPPQGGGLVSLVSRTGALAWPSFRRLNNPPSDLDCSLIDVDNDGINDCIVIGQAFIAAITPIKGETKWRYPSLSTVSKDLEFEFPLVLPDLNGDGVLDLAAISYDYRSQILLISGSDGSIIKQTDDKNCIKMTNLQLDVSQTMLHYECSVNDFDRKISALEIGDLFKPHNGLKTPENVTIVLNQHTRPIIRKNFVVGDYILTAENSGTPPFNCSVNVTVMNNSGQIFWHYLEKSEIVMIPVIIQFKQSVSGFLLKFWQWLPTSQEEEQNKDYFAVRKIKESVVLVVFNGTGNLHVVSASQSDIIQLCYAKQCQPDHELQGQSMLLSDLNEDGLQELVSYLVTFVNLREGELNMSARKKTLDTDWQLQSKVQVIHLEAELPKLYENRLKQLTVK